MDIFNQNKFLIRIVIMLTVLNIFSIGVFLWRDFLHKPPFPPPPNERHNITSILEKELKLNEEQSDKIRKLRSTYTEKENIIVDKIRDERDSMHTEVFSKNTNAETVKSLARNIAENEYQMEMLRFEQGQEIKSICTPEQLKKFEGLVLEIRDYLRPDNPRKRK